MFWSTRNPRPPNQRSKLNTELRNKGVNDTKGHETGGAKVHHVTPTYRSVPGTGVLWR